METSEILKKVRQIEIKTGSAPSQPARESR